MSFWEVILYFTKTPTAATSARQRQKHISEIGVECEATYNLHAAKVIGIVENIYKPFNVGMNKI